jgi:HSP20 family protein
MGFVIFVLGRCRICVSFGPTQTLHRRRTSLRARCLRQRRSGAFGSWHGFCSGSEHHHLDKETIMSLVRWDPFHELDEMSTRLNRIFGRSTAPSTGDAGKDTMMVFDWSPTVDIAETPEEFHIKAELPEVKTEDVKVSVDNRVLRLEGMRKQEKEDKGKKYHRIERSYGSFLRTFALPDNVDDTKVRAVFKDGVLNVHLPKIEKAKPAIEVKVA